VTLFLPAILVVGIDQVTKYLFWNHGRNYTIIEGFFNITLVRNAGAAFGMFQGGRAFFIAASVAAIVLITYLGLRLSREDGARRVWLGLILGGAIGNLIDRVLHGEVVDFLQIGFRGHYWPVFNVADMGVTVGATMLVLSALWPRRAPQPAQSAAAAPNDATPRT
jgi:signal peptidase II